MARGSSKSFTNSVDNWIKDTLEASHQVQHEAVQGFVDTLQGNMPNESGNLRNSVVVSATPIAIGDHPADTQFPDRRAENAAVIQNMQPDGHIYVGVQSPYTLKDNYGSTGTGADGKFTVRPGKFWSERTVAAWRGIVRSVAKKRGGKVK